MNQRIEMCGKRVLATCLTNYSAIPLAVAGTSEEMYQGVARSVFVTIKKLFDSSRHATPEKIISEGIDANSVYEIMLLGAGDISDQVLHLKNAIYSEVITEHMSSLGSEEDVVKAFFERVTLISSQTSLASGASRSMDVISKEAVEKILHNKEIGLTITGMATKHKMFNHMTEGWQSGLSVIYARPGMGKTTVALDFIVDQAKRGVKVGFVSHEMTEFRLACQIIADQKGYDKIKVKKGQLTPEQLRNVIEVPSYRWMQNIIVEEFPGNDLGSTMAAIYKLRGRGCSIVFVDHIHHMTVEKMEFNPERMYTEIARTMADTGTQQDFPIVALAQANRRVESRDDKRPLASDVKAAGSIEELAELMISLYRPAYYGITEDENGMEIDENYYEMIVRKNRESGPTGIIPMIKTDYGCFEANSEEAMEYTEPPTENKIDLPSGKSYSLDELEDMPF